MNTLNNAPENPAPLSDAPAESTTPSPIVPVGLDWQLAIAQELIARGVSVAAYVPDSRLNGVLAALGVRDIRLRNLAREEECVAYAAGQRIADARPVVLSLIHI